MKGLKSSATIQQDMLFSWWQCKLSISALWLCTTDVLITNKCDVLKLYSIWQVSNFIKIKIIVLSVQAIPNWCWQGTIIFYMHVVFYYLAAWSSAIICKSLTELLHWWGWNLCHILSNYKSAIGFVKKQSPLVFSGLSVLLFLSTSLWFCCNCRRFIFLLLLTRRL